MLELIILGTLYEEALHGYELKQRITLLTGQARPISDGALYPAIARLERKKFLTRHLEPGLIAAPRFVLSLTLAGEKALLSRLHVPDDLDISDRERFFTLLAFIKFLPPDEQRDLLKRRLTLLESETNILTPGGLSVTIDNEIDYFRRGVLQIAQETSAAEKVWLRKTIEILETRLL